jgi:TRAP-type C4-dicarboxylate transport system substrate-binding protein
MKLFRFIILGVIGTLFLGCSTTSNKRIIRLGHGLDVTHSVHQAMLKADEYLNEFSEEKCVFKFTPTSSWVVKENVWNYFR